MHYQKYTKNFLVLIFIIWAAFVMIEFPGEYSEAKAWKMRVHADDSALAIALSNAIEEASTDSLIVIVPLTLFGSFWVFRKMSLVARTYEPFKDEKYGHIIERESYERMQKWRWIYFAVGIFVVAFLLLLLFTLATMTISM
jgi:hypothetical protein